MWNSDPFGASLDSSKPNENPQLAGTTAIQQQAASIRQSMRFPGQLALAGYGAVTMANALSRTVAKLPQQLWLSLTWDRGKELSDHARFTVESGVSVFFADPHSPWQRGSNENTNGLLRQYFPKGTDLSRWGDRELQAVANTLNTRPRKTLGWRTPAEALNQYLQSV
jgi:IS30 family transposase